MCQPFIDVSIISAGAYNRNIDKLLACKVVWLRETIAGSGRTYWTKAWAALVSHSRTAILPPLFHYDVIGRHNRIW